MTDKLKAMVLSNALHYIVGFTQYGKDDNPSLARINEVAWKALLDTGMAAKK